MQRVKVEVEPTRSALATRKQHLGPRAVVGFGIKIFVPRPLHYVTRSPGRQATWKLVPITSLVLHRIKMADDRSEKELIEGYFHQGYQNDVILEFLSVYHNITISLSSLKRRLRAYGLRRVRNEVNEQEVKDIITREVNNGCGSLGYRAIWHLLRLEYHLHVPRRIVARIAKEVDGVQLRKRRRFTRRRYLVYGPNFCWHADGK